MRIEQVKDDKKRYLSLLLLADEQMCIRDRSAAPLDFFEKTGPEPCGFSIFGLTGERERGYPVKEKPPVCKRCRGGKLRFLGGRPPF